MYYFLLLFFYSTLGFASSDIPVVAVIGDHYSLGAWADPNLTYDFNLISNRMSSADVNLGGDHPKLLPFTEREYREPGAWIMRKISESLLNQGLLAPQMSWPAQIGLLMGLRGSDVVLAVDHQSRVEDLPRQADRLLKHSRGFLPKHLFIFYPVADLCRPSLQAVTTAQQYEEALERGLRYLVQNSVPHPEATTVYLVTPPSLPFELTKPQTLSKQISFSGVQTTCGDAREKGFALTASPNGAEGPASDSNALIISQFVPFSLPGECPVIFDPLTSARKELGFFDSFKSKKEVDLTIKSIRKEQLSRLATITRAYRKATERAGQKISDWLSSKHKSLIKVKLVKALETFPLNPEWLAGDCFHLSQAGHKALADRLVPEISL